MHASHPFVSPTRDSVPRTTILRTTKPRRPKHRMTQSFYRRGKLGNRTHINTVVRDIMRTRVLLLSPEQFVESGVTTQRRSRFALVWGRYIERVLTLLKRLEWLPVERVAQSFRNTCKAYENLLKGRESECDSSMNELAQSVRRLFRDKARFVKRCTAISIGDNLRV